MLVTGPTGSGKSTTLASMIDRINAQRRVPHRHDRGSRSSTCTIHKRSAVNQREIGVDAVSFPRAVRAVLREDPDVVLVGEMRDPETIASALTVAETGHLVLASLHTNDAAQSVDRDRRRVPGRPAAADPGAARRLAPGDRLAAA